MAESGESDVFGSGSGGGRDPLPVECTVRDLSRKIKKLVERGFPSVRVRGEIFGYRGPHSSGHCYFSLKDSDARLDAIVWRSAFGRLCFKPKEGAEVIAAGRLTTYPGKSGYQLIVEGLEPFGAGALTLLFERRKVKLAAEGLFSEDRKQPIPFLPRVIGVVTSPSGAVLHDILHRLGARCPRPILLWSVRVQGDGCAGEVAAAIRGLNALPPSVSEKPDLIIIARGGGSYEELWGFNEEIVVRAVAESKIPIISAIGHESDWTLVDLAADRRAPTPTAAAEMATPVRAELLGRLNSLFERCMSATLRSISGRRRDVDAAARVFPKLNNLLALPRQRVDVAESRLVRGVRGIGRTCSSHLSRAESRFLLLSPRQKINHACDRFQNLLCRFRSAINRLFALWKGHLTSVAKLLDTLSYRSVLARGYALVRDGSGHVVRSAHSVSVGDSLGIELSDGVMAVLVRSVPPGGARTGISGSSKGKGTNHVQGLLFARVEKG